MTEKTENHGAIRRPTIALISKALNEAVQDAVEVHRLANLPLVVDKDGRVELISPDSIPASPASKTRRKRS